VRTNLGSLRNQSPRRPRHHCTSDSISAESALTCALLDERGEKAAVTAAPPDGDGLRHVAWVLGFTIASDRTSAAQT